MVSGPIVPAKIQVVAAALNRRHVAGIHLFVARQVFDRDFHVALQGVGKGYRVWGDRLVAICGPIFHGRCPYAIVSLVTAKFGR